jgi:cyanophycin synthetase
MKIVEIRALQGANFWSKKPVVRMLLDMENLDGVLTNQVPGFTDRLVQLIPSLKEHRCSEKEAGGLVKIMNEGTPLYHVMEHIAIELQYLAYMDTTFCKTFPTKKPGLYQIVFEYWVEDAGIFVGEECVRIVQGIVDGAPDDDLDIDGVIREIKGLRDDHYLGPSTMAIVDEARRRDITVIRLDDYNLVQLGEGKHQKRIQASLTSGTSLIAAEIASNKKLTKMMLEDNGIPVPPGTIAKKLEHALEDAHRLGYPVVVKPFDGHHGKGITIGIRSDEELQAAFERAIAMSAKVVVEKMMVGNDYRILLVDGRFIAAAHRIPARVVGDGVHTIRELIEIENRNPKRGRGHENFMTLLGVTPVTESILAEKGYTLDTVLAADERFYLERTANLSTGGMAFDVTAKVHPANRFMFERVARIIGLDIAGLDVLAPTLETPLTKNGGVIIEVNAAPGLRMHLNPSEGKPRNVGAPILDMLFPPGSKHDIPIVSVTGTNGKTTTVRLINHILKGVGYTVGMTTTDGIYIRDKVVLEGDTSGPRSARLILQDPTVDCAVFETARGGLLRAGLGYGTADVGICMNVTADHLGLGFIETVEELARLKSIVVETVRRGGTSVLNAEDKWCREMAARCTERVVWFSLNPQNPTVQAHVENGGTAVVYQNGYITILDGDAVIPVARAYEIPITLEGKAYFNIQNAMAAVAACHALKLKMEEIKAGLASFFPSPAQTPGRMNIIPLKGFDVMIDYAHNPRAYHQICDLIAKLDYKRRVLVLDAVGDRRDEDITELSQIASKVADQVVIYEDKDLRGRQPGEIAALLDRGFDAAGFPRDRRTTVLDEFEAIASALNGARPGDLIVYMTGRVQKAIQFIYDTKEQLEPLSTPPVEEP